MRKILVVLAIIVAGVAAAWTQTADQNPLLAKWTGP